MKRLTNLLLAALCLAALTLPHTPADACLHAMERSMAKPAATRAVVAANGEKDSTVIDRATDALNNGDNVEVLTMLYDHFGLSINQWALNPDVFGEREHAAVLLVSLAVLRSEGAYERYPEVVESTGRRQADNVRWAIRAVEGLAWVGYAADRHVAEAWARDPSLKKAALEKLLILADHGRLTSPFQKELLARLIAEGQRGIELAAN